MSGVLRLGVLLLLGAQYIYILRGNEIRLCGHRRDLAAEGVGDAGQKVQKPSRRVSRDALQRHHARQLLLQVADQLPGLVEALGAEEDDGGVLAAEVHGALAPGLAAGRGLLESTENAAALALLSQGQDGMFMPGVDESLGNRQ